MNTQLTFAHHRLSPIRRWLCDTFRRSVQALPLAERPFRFWFF